MLDVIANAAVLINLVTHIGNLKHTSIMDKTMLLSYVTMLTWFTACDDTPHIIYFIVMFI